MPEDKIQMTGPTDRDRELAAYWTERGDLRAWIAGIIAAVRRDEREECAQRAFDAMLCATEPFNEKVINAIRNAS